MHLRISPNDGVPIYLQIVNQVKYLVAAGRLEPGAELPPIRALAERLLINPNTVAGVVLKRGTAGTYVSDAGSPLARRERLRILNERIDALLAEAGQLGFATDELFQLIRQRSDRLNPPVEESR